MSTFTTRPGYAYAATVSQAGGQCRIDVTSQNLSAGAGTAPVAEPSLKTVVNQTKGGNLCLSGKAVSDPAPR